MNLHRRKARYFPIMAVSGNARVGENWRSAGMDDYLEKPYSFDALYEKINELTVKVEKIYFEENNLCLKKGMPMDQNELRELIE